jgi:hypothetical protein
MLTNVCPLYQTTFQQLQSISSIGEENLASVKLCLSYNADHLCLITLSSHLPLSIPICILIPIFPTAPNDVPAATIDQQHRGREPGLRETLSDPQR